MFLKAYSFWNFFSHFLGKKHIVAILQRIKNLLQESFLLLSCNEFL